MKGERAGRNRDRSFAETNGFGESTTMEFTWQYPLYLVPYGPGYVSLVEQRADAGPTHLLAVYTTEDAAEKLIERYELPGQPRPLKNAREFRWLVQSLKKPITEIAFDAEPTDDALNAEWTVAIPTLLDDHLEFDNSPWNYPVFVVAHRDHFACIEGESNDQRPVKAVALFTTEKKADGYLAAVEEPGNVEVLSDLDQTTAFLRSLSDDVAAVALDPTIDEGLHTAKHCFAVQTLLDKYLVRKDTSE